MRDKEKGTQEFNLNTPFCLDLASLNLTLSQALDLDWLQQQVKKNSRRLLISFCPFHCSPVLSLFWSPLGIITYPSIDKGRSQGSSHPLSSMETISTSVSVMSNQLDASNLDELSMEQSLLFSDSLKDLKNLKSQLYSAAEYFEISYTTDDHKQFVVNTLKEYAIKALVNTVDHLGSVSFKVNDLLDEKVDEVSVAEFQVSCIEQKIRTCQELVDREGLLQQSLVIKAPKYHKQYILPGESMPESGRYALPKYENPNAAKDVTETLKFQAVHPTIVDKAPSFRKMPTVSPAPSFRARSVSPRKIRSPSPSQPPGRFSSAEKRAASPIPRPNPLARSGSLAIRMTALNSSSNIRRQSSSPTQKSASMRLHAERIEQMNSEQNPSKGKKFLKSLLGRRKSKKDNMLYNYLDEY